MMEEAGPGEHHFLGKRGTLLEKTPAPEWGLGQSRMQQERSEQAKGLRIWLARIPGSKERATVGTPRAAWTRGLPSKGLQILRGFSPKRESIPSDGSLFKANKHLQLVKAKPTSSITISHMGGKNPCTWLIIHFLFSPRHPRRALLLEK